jgi:hypothetical protein
MAHRHRNRSVTRTSSAWPPGEPHPGARSAALQTWTVVKKVFLGLAIGFVLYYLVTEPRGAADAVREAASAVGDAFESVVAFLTRLFG